MQPPKQEQRSTARRNQILDAAARVFAQKGFHPTTIKDIAREARIADGTVYIYFASKTELLLGIFDRMTETARGAADMSTLAGMDLRSFIKAYISQPLIAFQADNFELFRVIISETMVNDDLRELYYQRILQPMIALAEDNFQHWAAQHAIKPTQIKLLMHTVSSLILGLIVQRIMGDSALASSWDEMPDFLTDLLLDGIRSDQS